MTDPTDRATVQFKLTPSDVFRAVSGRMLRRTWFLLLVPIAGAATLVWAIVDPAEVGPSLSNAWGPLIFGVLYFIGAPYLHTRTTMKNPNFREPIALTVSGHGIEAVGAHSNANIGWPMVKGVSETKRAILIHLKSPGFQVVPKRQLSAADQAAFKDILRRYAPGKVKLANGQSASGPGGA